jgi:adenine-specific DNA-methyltransferase
MARGRRKKSKKKIKQYSHKHSDRLNNPPVGLGEYEIEDEVKKEYSYDPHLDPQLIWAGKSERSNFKVDTVSLHVHERIDPKTVINAIRKKNGPQQTGLNGPIRRRPTFNRY